MGKITYGIKLAKSSPFSVEIKSRKKRLIQYTQENNEKLVGRVLLELADLYLDQADHVEKEDPTTTGEYYRQQDLEECLNYCKKAIRVFKSKKLYRYLAKTYMVMTQCYHKIPDFDNGVTANAKLLELFKSSSECCLKDNLLLQQAYKLLADAYFNHAHEDRGIKKFSDFKYAEQFYEKERKLILKMTAADVGGDELILKNMLRSSNFNLGVIKSKLSYEVQDMSEARKYLTESIQGARLIRNVNDERESWWELGNLYSARGKWELALDSRWNELQLIKKYHPSDYINVMLEIAKIYIMMENYSSCMESCREMRSWINKLNQRGNNKSSNNGIERDRKKKRKKDDDAQDDNDDEHDFEILDDLVQSTIDASYKIRDQRKKLKQLINSSNSIKTIIKLDKDNSDDDDHSQFVNNHHHKNNMEYKKICYQIMEESLSLAKTYNEMELANPVLNTIDTGLKYCNAALDNNNNPCIEEDDQDRKITDYPFRVLELELLETKATVYMQWFFTSLTVIEDLNELIIRNAKEYIKDEITKMDILIRAFERFTQIYYYFNNAKLYDKWMKVSEQGKKQYNQMISNENKMDLDKIDDDKMDIDNENKDEINEDKIYEEQLNPDASIKNSVLVSLDLKGKRTYILISIDDLQKSMEWLASEVSRLIWERHSVDPDINYFTLDGQQLPTNTTLDSLLTKPIRNFEANIIGYVERSLSDTYENICERLKTRKNLKIVKALNEQTMPCAIDLRGTGLTADDVDSLIKFLNTITTPFDQIDLSANSLDDDDIIKLFDAIPCPPKIILNSNLLTLKSFDYFTKHENRLKSFDFSYNMFWSISQKQISHFYSKQSNLDHFLIDGYTILNDK